MSTSFFDSFTGFSSLGSHLDHLSNQEMVQNAFSLVHDRLQELALSGNGFERLDFVFEMTNPNGAQTRLSDWANSIFPDMPEILVLADAAMNGAAGAYSAERDTIYIAESLVDRDNLTGLTKVVAEEYSHALDQVFNPGGDTAGDEGELFSRILLGEEISDQELARLRGEDDRGFLNINGAIVAVEFDNSTGTAYSVGTLSGTRSFSGFVGSSDTNDYYSFYIANTSNFSLSLSGLSADADVALLNSSGSTIVSSRNTGSTSESITRQLSVGTHYVRVYPYSTANTNYNLSLTANAIDDFSANTSTTGSVTVGGSSTGVVNSNSDRDWFRVSLQAGRTYRFNLNGNTLSDPALYLRNSSGSQLAYNDDFSGLNSQITYTATSSGTYYLDAGAYSSGTGSYTLLATDTSPSDDFSANTSTTGSVTVGASSTGVVNSNSDRDWFRVSLNAGQTYRFNLNGNTLSDPSLYLRNSSGTQLAYNDDFSGLNSQITYTPTSTGIYYLDAGAYSSGTGSYNLLASLISTPTPITDDFTDNTSTTGSVAIGGSSTGVVNSNGDRDWFRVSLLAGQTYRFNLNGSTLGDPTLYLRNSSGTQLAYNDDFTGLNSQITYTATSSGTYFLDAGTLSSGTGSYTLLASSVNIPVPPTDDFTANTSTTGSVTVGGSSTGVVNSNGDRDWFRVSLQSGRTYRFSLESGSLIDSDLYLRGATGTEIAYDDDSGGSLTPIITFTCNTTGTYYLDAGSANNVGVGSYTLRAVDTLPNDDFAATTSTTGSVTVGGSSTGVVNSNGDRDWFRISLQAGQTYRFNLNGNTLGDPTLYLRNSSGTQLAYNDDFSGLNSQITYTATGSDTYFLDAGAYSSGTGSYTLTATNTTPSNDDYAGDTSTTGTATVGRQASGVIDFVGDRDWWRVSLQAGRTYRFDLSGNTLSDPTLTLWNSTGDTALASNDNFSNGRNSQITYTASTSSTYFLDAGAIGSLLGSYNLSATDITSGNSDRIAGLQDTSIRQSVNTALNDNLFTHQELTSLLRSTATAGVTSAEFSDLRLIANNLAPYLNATSRSYTQYIFNALVNGNTANQWWTGGNSTRVALGNLSAGSSELQLNRLVDKWFGGNDLPTNFVGGDSAAGANSLTFTYGQMTGSLFVNGISYADINQGQAGTCYFLAAASTLANNQSQFIQNMFLDNGNNTYGVRFYGTSGNEIWVTVNRSVPVTNGQLALAGNSTQSLTGEMWVALAEKAYAQANEIGQFGRTITANSFSSIEGGDEDALRHISNRATTTYSVYYRNSSDWTVANSNLSTWNSYLNAAITAVNAGRSLMILSDGNTFDSSGKRNFVSGHAFAITGYNASTQRFTIANPWGAGNSSFAGVFESTWSDLFNIRAVVSWA